MSLKLLSKPVKSKCQALPPSFWSVAILKMKSGV